MASQKPSRNQQPDRRPKEGVQPMELIFEAIRGLQFGSVTIVIQDGVVVLIERTEKLRVA